MELLMLALFVSSLTVLNQAIPLQQSGVAGGEELPFLVPGTQAPGMLENGDDKDEEELVGDPDAGDPDFEDDDDDNSFLDLVDPKDGDVDSLMHVHQKGGEILVPCFGMWWPVGGPPIYEYVEDYYDNDKKRRRSRKRKKAKARRKKS